LINQSVRLVLFNFHARQNNPGTLAGAMGCYPTVCYVAFPEKLIQLEANCGKKRRRETSRRCRGGYTILKAKCVPDSCRCSSSSVVFQSEIKLALAHSVRSHVSARAVTVAPNGR
jgi:hypothetical protein